MPYNNTSTVQKQKSNMAASFKMAALFMQNLNILGYKSNTIGWISMKLYMAMVYYTRMSAVK